MKISPTIVVLIAVLLSVATAGSMLWINYDALFKPEPEIEAEFTSIEFDADDTSYSPAETHSMNQLSKELVALKEKLLERESELDARESAIAMDLEALEKQKYSAHVTALLGSLPNSFFLQLGIYEFSHNYILCLARLKDLHVAKGFFEPFVYLGL